MERPEDQLVARRRRGIRRSTNRSRSAAGIGTVRRLVRVFGAIVPSFGSQDSRTSIVPQAKSSAPSSALSSP